MGDSEQKLNDWLSQKLGLDENPYFRARQKLEELIKEDGVRTVVGILEASCSYLLKMNESEDAERGRQIISLYILHLLYRELGEGDKILTSCGLREVLRRFVDELIKKNGLGGYYDRGTKTLVEAIDETDS